MCKVLSLFEIVNMGISACEICPKMTFLGSVPNLVIIVDQIQVKLVSAQTCPGKVLLQSILVTLDFPTENVKKSI